MNVLPTRSLPMLVPVALFLTLLTPTNAVPAARYSSSFRTDFSNGVDYTHWNFADGYANGQPFNNGWSARNHHITGGALSLDCKRESYQDTGSASGGWNRYPYTSAEIRTREFHGVGCFSVCMKPSGVSGISSSFYAHSGEHDVPDHFHDPNPLLNEIDVEFVGKDTTRVQTNYFSRIKDPHANSGSGVERWHDLGFDAAANFHAYGYRWTHDAIEWYADGKLIRTARASESRIPSPDYSPMRIVANTWPVNRQAEEWAGPLDTSVYQTSAKYRWMKFTKGHNCHVESHC